MADHAFKYVYGMGETDVTAVSFIKIDGHTPMICFYRGLTLNRLQKRLWLPS